MSFVKIIVISRDIKRDITTGRSTIDTIRTKWNHGKWRNQTNTSRRAIV